MFKAVSQLGGWPENPLSGRDRGPANNGSTYTGKPTFNAVITFGAGLTLPSFDLVALPLATGPVFFAPSTFFSMATVVSPKFDWLLYAIS